MGALVSLSGITKSFARGEYQSTVLRAIELDIARGERVAITGPSGVGKSTLMAIVGMVDGAYTGTYEFDGRLVQSTPEVERARWRLEELGIVFQGMHLLPSLSVSDNIELPGLAAGHDPQVVAERARRLMTTAGLAGHAAHHPASLSGGQRRRVAVARALINEPALVLADEPTAELDTESARAVRQMLLDAADAGATLLATSHDPALSGAMTTQYELRDGRLHTQNVDAAANATDAT